MRTYALCIWSEDPIPFLSLYPNAVTSREHAARATVPHEPPVLPAISLPVLLPLFSQSLSLTRYPRGEEPFDERTMIELRQLS